MGGTTAWEVHCSGSWPAWMACVAKCSKLGRKPSGEASFSCMLNFKERREARGEGAIIKKPGRQGGEKTAEPSEREPSR